MLVLGALGGAAYALIPALFKVRFGASEILTSLMLVYVAELLLDYLVRGPWRDPEGLQLSDHRRRSIRSPRMPTLIEGSRLHLGAVFALLVGDRRGRRCSARTLRGFEIKLVGAGAAGRALCGLLATRG